MRDKTKNRLPCRLFPVLARADVKLACQLCKSATQWQTCDTYTQTHRKKYNQKLNTWAVNYTQSCKQGKNAKNKYTLVAPIQTINVIFKPNSYENI